MSHHSFTPAYHPLAQAISLTLLSSVSLHAAAADSDNPSLPHTQVETIVVTAKPTPNPQNKDITDLGQITKTAETLQRQQVESIRDLTRYDAGVAVNESVGRGTSSGFSIRGAEKERVAVMVDGLSQGETISRAGNGSGTESGAKNEVEYENLKMVEISKGANSTYAGSGALGGAVMMQTKDASDFVTDDEMFGGRVKAGYTSKDDRYMYSVGLGGQKNGWEGFVQYTNRKGHELKSHDDIYDRPATTVNNVITSVDDHKIVEVAYKDPVNKTDSYNRLAPKIAPLITQSVSFSADDLTGPDRRIPNPMNYDSDSLLSKVGYHFNDEHYVGAVLEDTKQTYDVRNMFNYQYHSTDFSDTRNDTSPEAPVRSGMIASIDGFPQTTPIMSDFYKYTPTSFFTDIHHNKRLGFEYKYTPANTDIVEDVYLQLDKQQLNASSNNDLLNCAKWSDVNRDCSATEAGQFTHHNEFKQSFDTKRIKLQAHKNFDIKDTSHRLAVETGYKTTVYNNSDFNEKNAAIRYLDRKNPEKDVTLTKALINTGKVEDNVLVNDYYPFKTVKLSSKTLSPLEHDITHKNYFIGINDNINITDKLGATVGIRYDSDKFESDLSNIIVNTQYTGNKDTPIYTNGDFSNTSYNLGLFYLPIQDLELAYKYSTGFRVPSFGEQLGITGGISSNEVQPPLKAETAQNHEIGAIYYTDFGYIKGTYFRTNYENFIDRAIKTNPDGTKPFGFTNYQDVKVHGFDVTSEIELNALWDKAPYGLNANLSAGLVKMRDSSDIDAQLDAARSYAFDMVQPLRVIYGISYTEPSDKWGVALNTTYSAAKDADELSQKRHTGKLKDQVPTSDLTSPSWRVTDLTGHYRINDNFVIRGGVYNIFNYGYLTWESLRQNKDYLDFTGVDDVNLLAAPGRNYGLSMEFTF